MRHIDMRLVFLAGDMVFMDYRWYLESQMSTTYIDALGRPKMILANYDMFRFHGCQMAIA